MTDGHVCVAIYQTHTHADEAFSRLQFAGFGIGSRDLARNVVMKYIGHWGKGNDSSRLERIRQ